MAFRLQTLLDLKVRAEEAAEKAVAAAIADRGKAERQQTTLDDAVVAARERLRLALEQAANENLEIDPLAGAGHDRFRKRLRGEIEQRREDAKNHRTGPLAAAIAAEAAARARHITTRQEREALDKFKEKELAQERLVADRRAEDALGDLAIAALARKPR
jgi:flagellar biosynthesis chaperone FliJ